MNQLLKNKKGYLNENFKVFHLKDKQDISFDFHHHDFNKIIIFLSGNVTYIIEGKSYYLKPWDILLVNHHTIHKPIVDKNTLYERIVIWINPEFLNTNKTSIDNIASCFTQISEKSINLVRTENSLLPKIKSIILDLETTFSSKDFGADILSISLFMQFMVYLNRIFLGHHFSKDPEISTSNKTTDKVIQYINQNLFLDLTIELLANEFYVSKYYLMHKFKEETGYSLHNYIVHKRLLYSIQLLKEGIPVMKAAGQSGFKDYSSYLRAFRKLFHQSPKEFSLKSSLEGNPLE